tara:strand:- start:3791 stop:3991 length:201 start_codon:yes stop_codon:yes gene_type:complete
MTQIQDLIDQIMNAERLGLSVAEVADAKQQLALALAQVAFDVNQALSFDPFEDWVAKVDEFVDLEA